MYRAGSSSRQQQQQPSSPHVQVRAERSRQPASARSAPFLSRSMSCSFSARFVLPLARQWVGSAVLSGVPAQRGDLPVSIVIALPLVVRDTHQRCVSRAVFVIIDVTHLKRTLND